MTDTQNDTTPDTGWSLRLSNRQVHATTVLWALGLFWLILIGWGVDGLGGAAVGIVIAAVAVVTRPIVVAAVAQAGLLMLVPEITALSSLAVIGLFELGVVAVLLSDRPFDSPTTLLTIGFGVVFVITTVAVLIWSGPLTASAVLVALVAVLAYGIHRYERVSLGLVADETATHDTDTTTHGASE